MYTANKPIFEFLYAFIRENFLVPEIPSTDNLVFYASEEARPERDVRLFNRFERGPFLLEHLSHNYYPCGWLEFGQTTDIELDRAPQGYCYGLRYAMPIFVGPGQSIEAGGVTLHTFRDDPAKHLGLGDIISEVVGKAWGELHQGFRPGGNFQFQDNSFHPVTGSSGQLPLNDANWWVREWSVDVNGDVVDTISEWKEVLSEDPRGRAKTINWDFKIFEQEPLK